MTTTYKLPLQVDFCRLQADNLSAEVRLAKSATTISAQLKEFKVFYGCEASLYKMIAESVDNEVFHITIQLRDNVSREEKARGIPDVSVEASMGELRIVFLMKFVRDLLTFIDPFTNMKEVVKELGAEAGERGVSLAKEIYNSATLVRLDIAMNAPFIIIPLHSQSKGGENL